MDRGLRVVIIEDSATDFEIAARELKKGCESIELERVDTPSALHAALERGPCDAVISDFGLPGFDGVEALQIVRARDPDLPFILCSGTIGEEVAVRMLKCGVDDYVMKSNLTRLLPSLRAQLQDAEERKARRRSEQGLRRAQGLAKLAHFAPARRPGRYRRFRHRLLFARLPRSVAGGIAEN